MTGYPRDLVGYADQPPDTVGPVGRASPSISS
jgi:hypothetical protein